MKRLSIFLLIFSLLFIAACNKDQSSAARNTVSENGTVTFEEVAFLINLKSSDSSYAIIESIDSIHLSISGVYQTLANSIKIDTTLIDKIEREKLFHSNRKINYLVLATQNMEPAKYETAGEYSEYLNGIFELSPGEYVCLIEAFQIRLNDGSIKKYFPFEYTNFTIEQNTRSAFAGEITINI